MNVHGSNLGKSWFQIQKKNDSWEFLVQLKTFITKNRESESKHNELLI